MTEMKSEEFEYRCGFVALLGRQTVRDAVGGAGKGKVEKAKAAL